MNRTHVLLISAFAIAVYSLAMRQSAILAKQEPYLAQPAVASNPTPPEWSEQEEEAQTVHDRAADATASTRLNHTPPFTTITDDDWQVNTTMQQDETFWFEITHATGLLHAINDGVFMQLRLPEMDRDIQTTLRFVGESAQGIRHLKGRIMGPHGYENLLIAQSEQETRLVFQLSGNSYIAVINNLTGTGKLINEQRTLATIPLH